MMDFETYKNEVIKSLDDDFHDDNLKWIYDENQKYVSDEVESLIRLLLIMDTPVAFARMYLTIYREDYLARNYDGPQDSEAWSGGFADNH